MANLVKVKVETKNGCLIWHRWDLASNTGANQYYECRDCGSRYVRSDNNGDQLINYRWILRLDDHL